MKKVSTCETWLIEERDGLDQITVFWQDFETGKGRVTIECYGSAWSSYWGGMGNRTIKEFFAGGDDGYLFNRLGLTQFLKTNKGHEHYLRRIINAIRAEVLSNSASAVEETKS